jgi:hypothetical protein
MIGFERSLEVFATSRAILLYSIILANAFRLLYGDRSRIIASPGADTGTVTVSMTVLVVTYEEEEVSNGRSRNL